MNFGKHLIMTEEPHRTSLASLILLCRHYQRRELHNYFDFRDRFLDMILEQKGDLVCHYCGMKGLLREKPIGNSRQPQNLATIDHVVPQSKGGGRYDLNNCVVCCYGCNQRKKDKDVEKFEQTA